MKMLSIVPAVLAAAVALPLAVAPAAAQTTTTTRVVVHDDNGHHYGRNHWRHHRVVYRTQCRTEWRHHERERVCHRVRVTRM